MICFVAVLSRPRRAHFFSFFSSSSFCFFFISILNFCQLLGCGWELCAKRANREFFYFSLSVCLWFSSQTPSKQENQKSILRNGVPKVFFVVVVVVILILFFKTKKKSVALCCLDVKIERFFVCGTLTVTGESIIWSKRSWCEFWAWPRMPNWRIWAMLGITRFFFFFGGVASG